MEEDYMSVYLKGVYDERDKWQSKIKQKAEELRTKYLELTENMSSFKKAELNHEYIEKVCLLEELMEDK